MSPVKYYTDGEVAARIHRSKRWLSDWLRDNPVDPKTGEPLYALASRTKLFTAEHIVLIVDAILSEEEAGRTMPTGEGYVYFMDGGDTVKIGFSRSLEARFKKMKTDLPSGLQLLHIEPGTFRTKKVLHRHFAELRVRGEWFRKTDDLMAYIEQRKGIVAPLAE